MFKTLTIAELINFKTYLRETTLPIDTAFQIENRHPCLLSAYEDAQKPEACFLSLKSVAFYEIK